VPSGLDDIAHTNAFCVPSRVPTVLNVESSSVETNRLVDVGDPVSVPSILRDPVAAMLRYCASQVSDRIEAQVAPPSVDLIIRETAAPSPCVAYTYPLEGSAQTKWMCRAGHTARLS
jgi:hypothetical protein